MHLVFYPAGKKAILLGNEAIVRGALEAGIGFASTYPGTPASEIGDTFAEIAKEAGIYFEYSVNEKVATEAAAGASFCGIRSLVSFKHFGFNVASDSIFPLSFHGVKGGMVIVVADDPQCWSSGQSEQDSRYFARIAHMPMFEPSDSQECKELTKFAFDISEKYSIPAIIRITTRIAHGRGVVEFGEIRKGKVTGEFGKEEKNKKWGTMPPYLIEIHRTLHQKLEELEKISNEKCKIYDGEGSFGIIAAGIPFQYVMEVLDEMKLKIPLLKISMTWPLPKEKISSFIKNLRSVLVIEELEPIIENEVGAIAKEAIPNLLINGKNLLPTHGEYKPFDLEIAICKGIGKETRSLPERLDVLPRWPVLCPGCPHRATFWAAKVAAGENCVFGGDIGCYILGIYPPLETQDFVISMGAVQGITHGIKKTTMEKVISFIGDSTFYHAGIPGLINMVFNNSNPVVIVLDNRTTAMTGHQPHPGGGITGMGEKTREIKIEDIARGCGVENVMVVNPFNIKETMEAIKNALERKEVSVIVSRQECRLLFMRKLRKEGIKLNPFYIDLEKCKKCGICVYKFGCPAIHVKDNVFYIDENFCWSCGVCPQVCPYGAINVKK